MGARISNLAELMTSRTGKLHSTIGIQECGEKSQSCFHALILLLDAYLMITGYINIWIVEPQLSLSWAEQLTLSMKGRIIILLIWLPPNDEACACISGHHGHVSNIAIFSNKHYPRSKQCCTGSLIVKLSIL